LDFPSAIFKIYFSTLDRGSAYWIGVILSFILHAKMDLKALGSLKYFVVAFFIPLLSFWTFKLVPFVIASADLIVAIGIAILIYNCTKGRWQVIDRFLSHPLWLPLSRMGLSLL